MESLNETIRGKLTNIGWTFEALPVRDDSVLWNSVKEECALSTPELSMVKNTRCPVSSSAGELYLLFIKYFSSFCFCSVNIFGVYLFLV